MEYTINNSFQLPLLGLGTYTMHGEQLKNVISTALQLGYRLFDTATKYGNEEELGVALRREEGIFVQSKVHDSQLLGNLRYLRLNKKSVRQSFSLSCKRMGYAPDIYLLHSPFKGYERSFEKLALLRENNQTKAIGICNIGFDRLKKLVSTTNIKPDIVQVEIHPYHNNRELVDYCNEQGITVEARSPFAHGDVMQEWLLNEKLQRIAAEYGKSVPQVILRWITQQNVVAIVRTVNLSHLKEDVEIFDFNIGEKDMTEINSLNKNLSFGVISLKK